MIKWSRRPSAPAPPKRFLVKVKPWKLEGLDMEEDVVKMVAIETRWKGPKSGLLVPFHRPSKTPRDISSIRIARGESIEWDEEFQSICDFSVFSKDKFSFSPWEVSFKIIHVRRAESKGSKGTVLGKASLNIGELASKMEPLVERKLPITLYHATGSNTQTTLLISVSFVEIRNCQDEFGIVQNAAELDRVARNIVKSNSNKEDWFFRRLLKKKTEIMRKARQDVESSGDTDESAVFDSEGSPRNESSGVIDSDDNKSKMIMELEWPPSSETQPDSVQKVELLSWKRKRLSSGSVRKKIELLFKKTSRVDDNPVVHADHQLSGSSPTESIHSDSELSLLTGSWESKELGSRDGQAVLNANLFFASFDQCSEQADGEGACTALVTVIANWLQSNQGAMPTRPEFNDLITRGSSEWRKLCSSEAYTNAFPDKHFDLETVLQARLRPLSVRPDKSFVGFFSPEKFELLKGRMSFDEIWNEITSNLEDYEESVYIVSWNDHFFVLKVEANACYLIDTLGERLFEGCNQAYILRFDESSSMCRKVKKEESSSEERTGVETSDQGQEGEEIICRGKDCCREFIKRFLAAIPLSELETEEQKGTISSLSLHQRLQIEFHFSSSSLSSSSSSSTTSTLSLFS
ncbi:uncharacterized protein LOC131150641 [Malania oleifera]|uniref:uncharacterized protein LOC131150641 n=1 Tax=Malania oleifera TaxID=397392 RepID=UPI0025AE21C6|nr:uncharacterized protein LOC131150641 [Malania oleifera]